MNSVLRLMRFCLLNIGRSRQARTDRWLLAFGQSREKSGPSLEFSFSMRVSAQSTVCCFSLGRVMGRCERWNICSSSMCLCFSPGARLTGHSHRGVCLKLLFSWRCVFDAASLHLSETLPAHWFYFHRSHRETVRWPANQWSNRGMRRLRNLIGHSALWHSACQTQTHLK